jgi:hypothetical protein
MAVLLVRRCQRTVASQLAEGANPIFIKIKLNVFIPLFTSVMCMTTRDGFMFYEHSERQK